MTKKAMVAGVMLCSCLVLSRPSIGQDAEVAPREYAMALAQSEVPGGLVAPRTLLAQGAGMPSRETTMEEKAAFREGLASSLNRFNASKTGFRATRRNGVVHLRSSDEPSDVSAALERSRYTKGAAEVPALTAVYQYVVGAIRGVDPPEGFLATGVFPGPECPLYRPITVPEGSSSAIELLDQIVKQAPGLVWVVSYSAGSPNQDLKVGLMCPDGASAKAVVYP